MAEGVVAADQLRLFIERVERLEEEKKGIADDIRDVYAEAKANGYDPKIMRACVRLRKLETHTRQEHDAMLDTYREALGMANSEYYRRPSVAPASEPTPLEEAIDKPSLVDAVAEKILEAGYVRQPGTNTFTAPPLDQTVDNQPPFDLDAETYGKAVEFVKTVERVGPSRLQRELRIGWNAAQRYLERMAKEAILGPPDAMEQRAVLQPEPAEGAE
jgi:uncharacterized protein (UPF0335 family)